MWTPLVVKTMTGLALWSPWLLDSLETTFQEADRRKHRHWRKGELRFHPLWRDELRASVGFPRWWQSPWGEPTAGRILRLHHAQEAQEGTGILLPNSKPLGFAIIKSEANPNWREHWSQVPYDCGKQKSYPEKFGHLLKRRRKDLGAWVVYEGWGA